MTGPGGKLFANCAFTAALIFFLSGCTGKLHEDVKIHTETVEVLLLCEEESASRMNALAMEKVILPLGKIPNLSRIAKTASDGRVEMTFIFRTAQKPGEAANTCIKKISKIAGTLPGKTVLSWNIPKNKQGK